MQVEMFLLQEVIQSVNNILVPFFRCYSYIILGDAIREFAGECGIEFADDQSAVIDHLNYDVHDNGQV
jgi:hypothetical protein